MTRLPVGGRRIPLIAQSATADVFYSVMQRAGFVALLWEIDGQRARGERILRRMREAWSERQLEETL